MRSLRAPPSPKRLWLFVWATVLLVALVGFPTSSAQRHELRRCQRPPRYSVNNVEPMTLTQGRVTVVALLAHTCGFCQRQAAGLNTLQDGYLASGTDVSMFIVNQGSAGPGEYPVTFPVYQDDYNEQIWRSVYGGGKDDIFIFNRCGMLTYRISMPYSYLGFNYVTRAIQNSLHAPICRQCRNPGSDPHDVMMGDAPALRRSGPAVGRRRNRSRCPRDDELCKELRRARRRFNRLRMQRGMGHLSESQAVRLFSRLHLGGGHAVTPL